MKKNITRKANIFINKLKLSGVGNKAGPKNHIAKRKDINRKANPKNKVEIIFFLLLNKYKEIVIVSKKRENIFVTPA